MANRPRKRPKCPALNGFDVPRPRAHGGMGPRDRFFITNANQVEGLCHPKRRLFSSAPTLAARAGTMFDAC